MTKETEDALKEKAEELAANLGRSVHALTKGAEKLSEASEEFAQKSPGKRSSWLGYLLIIVAVSAEFAKGSTFGGFKFSDTMSANMMYIGGFLVVVGTALDVYLSLKAIETENARASKLDEKIAKLEEQAAEASKTVSRIWSWLAGNRSA